MTWLDPKPLVHTAGTLIANLQAMHATLEIAAALVILRFSPSPWAAARLDGAGEQQREEARMLVVLVLAAVTLAVLYVACGRAAMEHPA